VVETCNYSHALGVRDRGKMQAYGARGMQTQSMVSVARGRSAPRGSTVVPWGRSHRPATLGIAVTLGFHQGHRPLSPLSGSVGWTEG
jgi:hypothetical protein